MSNISFFKNNKVEEESSRYHPAEQVNWFDAKAYTELLNRYEGKKRFYDTANWSANGNMLPRQVEIPDLLLGIQKHSSMIMLYMNTVSTQEQL